MVATEPGAWSSVLVRVGLAISLLVSVSPVLGVLVEVLDLLRPVGVEQLVGDFTRLFGVPIVEGPQDRLGRVEGTIESLSG